METYIHVRGREEVGDIQSTLSVRDQDPLTGSQSVWPQALLAWRILNHRKLSQPISSWGMSWWYI